MYIHSVCAPKTCMLFFSKSKTKTKVENQSSKSKCSMISHTLQIVVLHRLTVTVHKENDRLLSRHAGDELLSLPPRPPASSYGLSSAELLALISLEKMRHLGCGSWELRAERMRKFADRYPCCFRESAAITKLLDRVTQLKTAALLERCHLASPLECR